MDPAGEHHQPHEGHDEAEDGHGHDPALGVLWDHVRAPNQDPHQATEDLQKQREEAELDQFTETRRWCRSPESQDSGSGLVFLTVLWPTNKNHST